MCRQAAWSRLCALAGSVSCELFLCRAPCTEAFFEVGTSQREGKAFIREHAQPDVPYRQAGHTAWQSLSWKVPGSRPCEHAEHAYAFLQISRSRTRNPDQRQHFHPCKGKSLCTRKPLACGSASIRAQPVTAMITADVSAFLNFFDTQFCRCRGNTAGNE